MKRTRALILGIAFTLVCGFYVMYCLRGFFIKPVPEFDPSIDPVSRKIISDWYAGTREIPMMPMDLESVIFALTHPYSPNPYRPVVSLDGLGGEGTYSLSYLGSIAVFDEKEGRPVFKWVVRNH